MIKFCLFVFATLTIGLLAGGYTHGTSGGTPESQRKAEQDRNLMIGFGYAFLGIFLLVLCLITWSFFKDFRQGLPSCSSDSPSCSSSYTPSPAVVQTAAQPSDIRLILPDLRPSLSVEWSKYYDSMEKFGRENGVDVPSRGCYNFHLKTKNHIAHYHLSPTQLERVSGLPTDSVSSYINSLSIKPVSRVRIFPTSV